MGVRKGQGYGVPKPKRRKCPEVDCGKKGVGEWKVSPHGIYRSCQYCGMSWGESSWSATKTQKVST